MEEDSLRKGGQLAKGEILLYIERLKRCSQEKKKGLHTNTLGAEITIVESASPSHPTLFLFM